MSEGQFTVTVEPAGLQFPASDGQSPMEAANLAGLFWPTICGGEGICLACMVPAPGAGLATASEAEMQALAKANRPAEKFRLACHAQVCGDVTLVQKRVRPAQPGDRLPFAEG